LRNNQWVAKPPHGRHPSFFELGYHPGITQKWLIGAVEKSL
jgi:hypothetical protein